MSLLDKKRLERLRSELTNAHYYLQELAGELAWAFSNQNYIPYDLHCEMKARKEMKKQRDYLNYLKRYKFVETHKIGEGLRIRLTEKGWNAALRDRIKTESVRCKEGYCFVIFDVPEKEKLSRRMLRHFLKECGFKRLQHSVWISNRDVAVPLRQLLQRKKLEQWIRIIVGDIVASSPLDSIALRRKYKTS